MAYAEYDDIVEIYGEQALHDVAPLNEDGTVRESSVNAALVRATAEVEIYLASRYETPLIEVPMHLTQITVDIAMYRMALNLGQQTIEHRQRYDDAINTLKLIATGKANIGIGLDTEDDLPTPAPNRRAKTGFLLRG
jgi:phage gp36-like protein